MAINIIFKTAGSPCALAGLSVGIADKLSKKACDGEASLIGKNEIAAVDDASLDAAGDRIAHSGNWLALNAPDRGLPDDGAEMPAMSGRTK